MIVIGTTKAKVEMNADCVRLERKANKLEFELATIGATCTSRPLSELAKASHNSNRYFCCCVIVSAAPLHCVMLANWEEQIF